jgi:hypothetical protein
MCEAGKPPHAAEMPAFRVSGHAPQIGRASAWHQRGEGDGSGPAQALNGIMTEWFYRRPCLEGIRAAPLAPKIMQQTGLLSPPGRLRI